MLTILKSASYVLVQATHKGSSSDVELFKIPFPLPVSQASSHNTIPAVLLT